MQEENCVEKRGSAQKKTASVRGKVPLREEEMEEV